MSIPSTVYRGHKINWSENSDEWTCYDLSDKVQSSPKLSLIKAAIDRLYLAERKASAVPCFEIGTRGDRTEGSVVEYLGEKVERSWDGRDKKVKHRVAVVAVRDGSSRPSRRDTELSYLMPSTAEAEAAWQHYKDLYEAYRAAEMAADEAKRAIPRMSPDDIAALVELHRRDEVQPA